jgi:hypothetical protein
VCPTFREHLAREGGGLAKRKIVARAYERFRELPVVVVLAVLWLVGAALLGLYMLVLYLCVLLLLGV